MDFLPDFGRPADYIQLDVSLVVVDAASGSPSDNHLSWTVFEDSEMRVERRLDIVREIGIDHLTNWGPLTKIIADTPASTTVFFVANLNLEEGSSWQTLPRSPPSSQARRRTVITNNEWNGVVAAARQ
ncbi:hypothetical protein C8J56DRAFT_1053142 [Mycena floridula]|nr:hypothetical protein C8J56DRAFT_1053142 [Mycena floridula]